MWKTKDSGAPDDIIRIPVLKQRNGNVMDIITRSSDCPWRA